jgi:hypothetical protein
MLGKESSKENKLNEYFRRRCSNYERFLCDRVWECALCARQAGKVEELELPTVTKVEALRRRWDDGNFERRGGLAARRGLAAEIGREAYAIGWARGCGCCEDSNASTEARSDESH